MNKFLKSMLAIVALVVCSTVARAVWDSTSGNMPNFYQLCWGLNSTSCVYGSSISNYVRIQTGGTDAVSINSSQAVSLSGALSVTGAVTNSAVNTGVGLVTTTLTASTTGQAITASSGQTADLISVSSFTSTTPTVRVAAGGQILPLRLTKALIDVLVPVGVGAVIICTDCTIPYSVCTATGASAAMWARAGSSTVGCGSNN